MNMHKTLGLDALPSLARRIAEAENGRTHHLRQLEELDNLLANLRSQFNDITNSAAPVASLPNEILSAIFEAGYLLPRSHKSELPFELLVSQVSRHWRNIAISTPSLWTNVVISGRRSSYLVTTFITRSGTLPLDLQVDVRGHSTMLFITHTITPHIGRCRRLCVKCDRFQHLSVLLKCFRNTFAGRLEFLQFSLEQEFDGEEDSVLSSDGRIFAGGTPSLQTFRLQRIGMRYCMPPGATLTTLHIHSLMGDTRTTWMGFCQMLSHLPALVHLVIHGLVVDGHVDDTTTIFSTLSSLRSVHLFSTEGNLGHMSLLSFISAPLLEVLVLEEVNTGQITHLSQHPSWTATSPRHPCLRSLSVTPYGPEFDQPAWLHLCHLFPTVRELTVLDTDPSGLIAALRHATPLDAQLSSSTITLPWPHLQTLSFSELGVIHVPLLWNMLSERIVQGHPLQKVSLSTTSLTRIESVDPFPQMRKHMLVDNFEPKRWPPGNFNEWYDEY